MAFGQQSGPPASRRDVEELLALLQAAGHTDFRDARGPMGFTQRQAAGKFTRDEAAAYLKQLRADADGEEPAPAPKPKAKPSPSPSPPPSSSPKAASAEAMLRRLPAEQLAAELQRRGWAVMEP